MNPRELPVDRLATTDAQGNRIYLYPSDVRGRYRTRRSVLNAVLMTIFLGLPWVHVGGHQAILLDLPRRRFALFGLTFWAHDAPLLVLVVGTAALCLALATAIWGRVWCGWGCPQTVFVDGLFRKIERWVEGDAPARRHLDAGPMSPAKLTKKAAKWALFAVAALVISHSFLAYFVGVDQLERMVASSPSDSPGAFAVMALVTGGILFDFGWFREQFCTLVCPYGRFQSVLMDDRSTVVAYDPARGEPRKGTETPPAKAGDCVNCYRCVQVCPTGIDIRRGVQMECIACTACMDACDDVMARLKRPPGLIRYGTQATTEGKKEDPLAWHQRARVLVTAALLVLFIGGLGAAVATREPLEMTLIRAVDTPYQEVTSADGRPEVINHFKMDLRNQTFAPLKLRFSLDGADQARGETWVVSNHAEELAAGQSERADLFIRFPAAVLSFGHAQATLQVESGSTRTRTEVRLVGPLR
ncbi:MAG TPA: cytochrome c oxidase accessory protein CcoG [Bdellovibrionota bacterium]|jgi:cytochrome c oxidase accessory protein FixG|nr:cytochrome c oxidase accessory protein CcoG [Bdellovibrionota bacterium]